MGSVGVLIYLREWIGSAYCNHNGEGSWVWGGDMVSDLGICIYWGCNLEHLLILYPTNLLYNMV